MTQVSDDFKRYLEANYPDDLLKISSPDVKDDVITSVCSRHDKTYLVWKMVPEWIKSLYCDRLPAEVFSGHEPWDKFIFNIEQSVMNQIPYDRTKLTAFVYDSIIRDPENCHAVGEKMEKGYSFETSANLQYNKILRSNLIKSDKLKTDTQG